MKTTIIDVVAPQLDVDYLTITDATTPPDLTDKDTCPSGALWQIVSDGSFRILRGGNATILFRVDGPSLGTTLPVFLGVYWLQDRYGWKYMGNVSFCFDDWECEFVSVAFSLSHGEPELDSVRVLRPCKKS